jgi:hypothetical protein
LNLSKHENPNILYWLAVVFFSATPDMLAEPESKYFTDALELCQAIHTVGLKVHLLVQSPNEHARPQRGWIARCEEYHEKVRVFGARVKQKQANSQTN